MNTNAIRTNHPLLLTAAIAVILFCSVGIAALMGWLPNSNSSPAPQALAAAPLAPQPASDAPASYPGYHPGPGPGSSLTPVPPPAGNAYASTEPERIAGRGYERARARPSRSAWRRPNRPRPPSARAAAWWNRCVK